MRLSKSLLVVLLLPQVGCSWLFSQPPPADYGRDRHAGCSTNPVPPVLDTLFTVTNLTSALIVATDNEAQNKGAAVGLGLSLATLWMVSAVYGYKSINECEQALAYWSGGRSFSRRRSRPPAASTATPVWGPDGKLEMPRTERARTEAEEEEEEARAVEYARAATLGRAAGRAALMAAKSAGQTAALPDAGSP